MLTKKIKTTILVLATAFSSAFAQDHIASFAQPDTHVSGKQPSLVETFTQSIVKSSTIADAVIQTAYKYIGRPYRRGSTGPSSFDCSGFTGYIFKSVNIALQRCSRDQYRQGEAVSKSELRKGDLVFFSGRGGGNRVGHVGMVVDVDKENNDFRFIHACSRGIQTDNFKNSSYYTSRYIGARRVIDN